MFDELKKIFTDILQDKKTHTYSLSKVIAFVGFIAATVFIWKLIILGTLTLDFFCAYLIYTTGTQTFNKFLDGRIVHKDTTQEQK